MTGENIKNILNRIRSLSKGEIIWMPEVEQVNEAIEQLKILVKYTEELERREQGFTVLKYGVEPSQTHICGHCGNVVGGVLKIKSYSYCSHCGYRLHHTDNTPETYTVRINDKDVVLKKGVEYEVIPKNEIFIF